MDKFNSKREFKKYLMEEYKTVMNPVLEQMIDNVLEYAGDMPEVDQYNFLCDILPIIPELSIRNTYFFNGEEDRGGYKHINEVWSDLRECKSKEEIIEVIENVPNIFGLWDIEDIGDGVAVTNCYEQQYDDYQEDTEEFCFEKTIEIDFQMPIVEKFEDLYIIGYCIEVGSDAADKYVKKLDFTQDSFNEIYKDGKDMWNNNEVSKFAIAILDKNTDSVVFRLRPDKWNFEFKNGSTYCKVKNLLERIQSNCQKSKSDEYILSWAMKDDELVKRQLHEKGYEFNSYPSYMQDLVVQDSKDNEDTINMEE